MNYLLQRIREPSTWAGIGILGSLFGVPPGTIDIAVQACTALAAVGSIVLTEGSR